MAGKRVSLRKPWTGITINRACMAKVSVVIFVLQAIYILKPAVGNERSEIASVEKSSQTKESASLLESANRGLLHAASKASKHAANRLRGKLLKASKVSETDQVNLMLQSDSTSLDSKSAGNDLKTSTDPGFPRLKNILESKTGNVAKPPAGKTCKEWLEEADAVSYQRDFREKVVVVLSNEIKDWTECSVGCKFTAQFDGIADASMFGGGNAPISILRSMEPKSYYPTNDPKTAHSNGYGVVMTVHLDSDVPVGYFSWAEYDIMKPLSVKKAWPAVAAAFISNCNANNFRLEAVQKLQQFVAIDSYGRCSNNRPYQHDKLGTIANYKFSLAFENSCEDDYVTEKFFQSLVAGSVPVVVGPKNIFQFAPSNNSFIYMEKADDANQVAEVMTKLANDDEAYEKMVEWKKKGPSDQFKALVDMAVVHSSCRLCIHLADKVWRKEEEKLATKRPCRCKEESQGKSKLLYHIYVRERGRFYFDSLFLYSDHLSLEILQSEIVKYYSQQKNFEPIWVKERPPILVPKQRNPFPLKVHRIYPAFVTQKDALYGRAWFRDSESLVQFLAQEPCPKLEFIFV